MKKHDEVRAAQTSVHDVCAGRLSPLTDDEVAQRITHLSGWECADGRLECTLRFESFTQSIGFINKVATIAQLINHHPDICIQAKKSVNITTWTRQMGCLTSVDFDLAEAIEAALCAEFGAKVAR